MSEFVDTNVLLYAYDTSGDARSAPAIDLVSRLGRARAGVLSVQVLQEFYVNATRKIAVPLAPASARDRIRALSLWRVHIPTASDVMAAGELADECQLSFWDAMIVRSAAQTNCTTLWTEDLSSGQRIEGVEIRNPFTE